MSPPNHNIARSVELPAPPCLPPAKEAQWFKEEVQPHEPKLRAWLSKQFPHLSEIDDVVQEAELKVLKAARRKDSIESWKSYLFATAKNCALALFRGKKNISELPVSELPELRILESDIDVAATVNSRLERELIIEAIDTLPPRCREILILRVLHGLDHETIAQQLGLSAATVRVQVTRGVAKISDLLDKQGLGRERKQ